MSVRPTIKMNLPTEYNQVMSGEMQVIVAHDSHGVVIDFGRNVSALKISADQAIALADKLREQAMAMRMGL